MEAFDNAVFTYAIASKRLEQYDCYVPFYDGKLIINHTSKTQVFIASENTQEAAVVGVCVDALGEIPREDVAKYIVHLENTTAENIYQQIKRFAGRFMILYRTGSDLFAFTDAYGLLQVNYSKMGDDICIASIDKSVGDYFGYPISPVSLDIRNGGDYSQPLPYNITMYDAVKVLLPNHYLYVNTLQPKRVRIPTTRNTTAAQKKCVVDRTIWLVNNILEEYEKLFHIACPLTAGRDSRVVFSFLNQKKRELPCYTFWHNGFSSQTPDIAIPHRIATDKGLDYRVIEDMIPSQTYLSQIKDIVGNYHSENTISLGYTFSQSFPEHILIHSDILDQIGKSSLGKNIPAFLATPYFSMCKLHNFSKNTFPFVKAYHKDITESGETHNKFDLFCIEQDGARWVSQGITLYSVCGVTALNLFNCGMILDLWLSLPRKSRMKFFLHDQLLGQIDPELRKYPVNPGEQFAQLKKSSFLMWLGTYVNYFLHYLRKNK